MVHEQHNLDGTSSDQLVHRLEIIWDGGFRWVSPAKTLMFTANMSSTAAPYYFSVLVENVGTAAASGKVVAAHACYI